MLRSERGQSLVELALVMPLLILLLTGIADLGRAFYSYIQITNAAREGARAASRLSCYSGTSAVDITQREVYADRIRTAVGDEVDDAIVLRDEDIVIDPVPEDECQMPGLPIEVTVSYLYETILVGNFTMSSSAAMSRIAPPAP